MNSKPIRTAASLALLLVAAACARESEEVARTPEPPPAATTDETALNAQMWVDDVELSGADTTGEAAGMAGDEFAPGDPIQVSMNVKDAPPDTTVTVQWVGPEDQRLGYEIKEVPAGQQTLSFTQENTMDWERGQYRAEVWVGDEKVSEQRFEISAGA